jgi:hypothetical protein
MKQEEQHHHSTTLLELHKDSQLVSYFNSPIKNITPITNISLAKVCESIKSDKLKQLTENVRNGSATKNNDLPYVTPSGTFNSRKNSELQNYSGIICIDLDSLKDRFINSLRDTLAGDCFLNPCLIFISPSNNGLKVFINIINGTAETHLQHFTAIEKYLFDTYQLKADQSCKDVSRACFLCHDPDVYFSNGFVESTTLLSIMPQQDENEADQQEEAHQQPLEHAIIPEIHQRPSDELNRMPQIHSRAISALKSNGWQQSGEEWTRPGKDPKNGISAKFNNDPKDGLWKFTCFSSNAFPFAAKGYTDVGIICLLEFRDDWKTCIGELATEYLSQETKPKTIKKPDQQVKIGLLPIDGMPPFIQEYITTCSEIFNTPRDYWAGAVIMATALGIGDKIQLVTKYENVPILWMNMIGNVSNGKTEPQRQCIEPFEKLDIATHEQWQNEYQKYEGIEAMSSKDRKDAGVDRVQKPVCFQYIVKDITPESLTPVHSTNQRGLMYDRDELKGLLDDFGKYTGGKSGEQSNLLSSYFRIRMVTNRKGGGINSVMSIPKPCIFIFGGMQPELIPTLAADNRAENGFLARFCNVWPDHTDKPKYNKNIVPEVLKRRWNDYIISLIKIQQADNITLSIEAENLYTNWFNKNAEISDNEDSGYLQGVYGKLDIIALRLSIVIYGMNLFTTGAYSQQISEDEMAAALNVTEYFRSTALKVYHKLFDNITGINTKDVIKKLSDLGNSQNKIAEVMGVSQPYVNKVLNK